MKQEIFDIVKDVLEQEIPEDTATDLMETGFIDSLGMIGIVTGIEERYGIEISGQDISKANFSSIDTIAALVKKYIEGGEKIG